MDWRREALISVNKRLSMCTGSEERIKQEKELKELNDLFEKAD